MKLEEDRRAEIIDSLTAEQESKLGDIFAEQAEGVLDDDLPDAFEDWLMDLTLNQLTNYLNK